MQHADKLAGLRMAMKEKGADIHLNTCLDDIAWLFNMRGNDIPYNPVVLSYAAVTMTEAVLFVQDGVLGEDIARELEKNCVTVRPYEAVYDYVKQIPETCRVLLDKSRTNYAICSGISSAVKILDEKSPVMLAKAVKNPVEVDNERNAHKKDGRGRHEIYILAETEYRKDRDNRNQRIGLPGRASQAAGELCGAKFRYNCRL